MFRQLSLVAAMVLLDAATPRADVRILDDPSSSGYVYLQDAVDAAQDGDTLVLGQGTYTSASIDGKGLVLMAASPGLAEIEGTLSIRNLPKGGLILLGGLSITGGTGSLDGEPAVILENNTGPVRIIDCAFVGGVGRQVVETDQGEGGDAVQCFGNAQVAIHGSLLTGGAGGGDPSGAQFDCHGGNGGLGLNSSNSAVAFDTCTVTGGRGGHCGARGVRVARLACS